LIIFFFLKTIHHDLIKFSSSDSDINFERKQRKRDGKAKSFIQPLNLTPFETNFRTELDSFPKTSGDLDPLEVLPKINFSEVGGLDEHVKSLKEMIILPLMYPEVFFL